MELLPTDIHKLIVSCIDHPPAILALSTASVYWSVLTKTKRDQILGVKYDFNKACECGYLWIAQWLHSVSLYHKKLYNDFTYIFTYLAEYKSSKKISDGNYIVSLFLATHKCHHEMVKWILLQIREYNMWVQFFGNFGTIWHTFRIGCDEGWLDVVQLIVEMWDTKKDDYGYFYIHFNDEAAFRSACSKAHWSIVRWLLAIGEQTHGKINIHARSDIAFCNACAHGNLPMAQLLVELGLRTYGKVDIYSYGKAAYRHAKMHRHAHITQWLIELDNNGYSKN